MPETISIVYEPLGSVGGKDYYHQTLVYENAAGEKQFATAVASAEPDGAAGKLSAVASSPVSARSGGTSGFGTLKTYSGRLSALSPREQEHWLGPKGAPYPSQTTASGPDLSDKWCQVQASYARTGAAKLPYSPLTQNSNSTAMTALQSAGIKPQATDHWAPASGTTISAGIPPAAPGPLQVVGLTNQITCTGCPIPQVLMVTSQQTILVSKMLRATIADCAPIVNIPPFGPCAFTPLPPSPSGGPCIPKPVGMWKPGSETTLGSKIPALRQTDTLQCAMGGVIMVLNPGQTQYLVK